MCSARVVAVSQGVGTYRQSSQLTRALPPALGAMLGAGVLVGPADRKSVV